MAHNFRRLLREDEKDITKKVVTKAPTVWGFCRVGINVTRLSIRELEKAG